VSSYTFFLLVVHQGMLLNLLDGDQSGSQRQKRHFALKSGSKVKWAKEAPRSGLFRGGGKGGRGGLGAGSGGGGGGGGGHGGGLLESIKGGKSLAKIALSSSSSAKDKSVQPSNVIHIDRLSTRRGKLSAAVVESDSDGGWDDDDEEEEEEGGGGMSGMMDKEPEEEGEEEEDEGIDASLFGFDAPSAPSGPPPPGPPPSGLPFQFFNVPVPPPAAPEAPLGWGRAASMAATKPESRKMDKKKSKKKVEASSAPSPNSVFSSSSSSSSSSSNRPDFAVPMPAPKNVPMPAPSAPAAARRRTAAAGKKQGGRVRRSSFAKDDITHSGPPLGPPTGAAAAASVAFDDLVPSMPLEDMNMFAGVAPSMPTPAPPAPVPPMSMPSIPMPMPPPPMPKPSSAPTPMPFGRRAQQQQQQQQQEEEEEEELVDPLSLLENDDGVDAPSGIDRSMVEDDSEPLAEALSDELLREEAEKYGAGEEKLDKDEDGGHSSDHSSASLRSSATGEDGKDDFEDDVDVADQEVDEEPPDGGLDRRMPADVDEDLRRARDSMRDNIESVLERGEKLDTIMLASDGLESASVRFQKRARVQRRGLGVRRCARAAALVVTVPAALCARVGQSAALGAARLGRGFLALPASACRALVRLWPFARKKQAKRMFDDLFADQETAFK